MSKTPSVASFNTTGTASNFLRTLPKPEGDQQGNTQQFKSVKIGTVYTPMVAALPIQGLTLASDLYTVINRLVKICKHSVEN